MIKKSIVYWNGNDLKMNENQSKRIHDVDKMGVPVMVEASATSPASHNPIQSVTESNHEFLYDKNILPTLVHPVPYHSSSNAVLPSSHPTHNSIALRNHSSHNSPTDSHFRLIKRTSNHSETDQSRNRKPTVKHLPLTSVGSNGSNSKSRETNRIVKSPNLEPLIQRTFSPLDNHNHSHQKTQEMGVGDSHPTEIMHRSIPKIEKKNSEKKTSCRSQET